MPYEANISNVASERDFYDEEIEARLVSKENVFGPVVQRLRLDVAATDDFPVIVDLARPSSFRTTAADVESRSAAFLFVPSAPRHLFCRSICICRRAATGPWEPVAPRPHT